MKKLAPAAALLLASARLLAAPEMILHDFGEVLEGSTSFLLRVAVSAGSI